MKSKIVSIVLCVMIVASISTPITVNVGEHSSSSNELEGPPTSNISEPNPQIVEQPSSGSNEMEDLTLSKIAEPNPQIGGQASENPKETEDPLLSIIPPQNPQIVEQPSPSSSGSGGLADSPWPMFRQNLNHTGVSPYDTSLNNGRLKWSFMTNGRIMSQSPVIGIDGTIYVGSDDGNFYAINPDGTEKWNISGRTNANSAAISSDGTIYVGRNAGNLLAIHPNGTEKWQFMTSDSVMSSPAISSEDTIYVGSEDYNFYAINPDGTEKWRFTTGSFVLSSPAICFDGIVYFGSDDNNLYAMNPNGTKKWNFMTGGAVRSSPAIGSDGTIYVGSHDFKLYAIKPDGTEKWNFPTGQVVPSSPAIGSDGTIYVGSEDYNFYAINPNGTEKWHFTAGNLVQTSPAIGSDGMIYFGSQDTKLYAIYPNGTEKWSFTTGDRIISSPAIGSDGNIYFGDFSYHGKLYALGTQQTQPPVANAGPDQSVDEGDTVYFNGTGSYDPNYDWHKLVVNYASDSALHLRKTNPGGPYLGAWEGGVMEWVTFSSPRPFWIGKMAGHLGQGPTGKEYTYYWKMHESGDFTLNLRAANGEFYADVYDETDNAYIVSGLHVAQGAEVVTRYLDNGHVYRLDIYDTYTPSGFPNDLDVLFHIEETDILLTPDKDSLVYYVSQNPLDLAIEGPGVYDITFYSRSIQEFYTYYANQLNHSEDEVSGGELGLASPPYNKGITPGEYEDIFLDLADELNYTWDLNDLVDSDGDGNFTNDVDATGPTPTYVYGDNGIYNVTLTVRTMGEEGKIEKIDQDVVFCVDVSGSMDPGSIPIIKDGLTYYVNEMIVPDHGAVVLYGGPAYLMNPLTDNYPDLLTDIGNIPEPPTGPNTPMGDAMNISIDELLLNGIKGHTHVIILLTDGMQNAGIHLPIPEAYNAAYHNITIYTIGLDSANGTLEETTLMLIADITGGKYYYAPNASFLITIYREIAKLVEYPYGEPMSDTDTMQVTVNNVAPSITPFGPFSGDEPYFVSITTASKDPGSDDLTFTWEFELGPTITNTVYNDGSGPDPYPSPWGTYPFSATDSTSHTYSDDGIYKLKLTVEDDDGGLITHSTNITVNNVEPIITPFLPTTILEEGTPFNISAASTDPGSDDLTFTWEFELGPTITNTYYNDGSASDPYPSPWGTYPFSTTDMVGHTYGDNGMYQITLTVKDDDGGLTTYSTNITVHNVAPTITPFLPTTIIEEGTPFNISAASTDPGSDDLIFTWEFELGPTITNMYYNDGSASDPYPSPWGIYPFSSTDMVGHTYGDNGVYQITLIVEDDDGDSTPFITNITVNNVAPTVDPGGPYTVDENSPITLNGIGTDPGSDDLTFTWEFELGPTISNIHYNDGISPEPIYDPINNEIKSPGGAYPFSTTDTVQHTYGDNGNYTITLTVEDDDGGKTIVTTYIIVNNVAPTILNIEAYMYVNFTLRVAGEKWHSVNITLYEDDSEIWSAGVTRRPGSPDAQAATLSGYSINFGSRYNAIVDYLPNDPRVNGNVWGGNPVWVILEFQDGTSERLHHTFNVRKTYWNSTHWNHIDPWEVNLTSVIYRHNITFEAVGTDPGSDDLIFYWEFGDGGTAGPNTYFNNGVNPDPFPSPEINPINALDKVMYAYSAPGTYTVTLTVMDDDGGIATTTLVMMIL